MTRPPAAALFDLDGTLTDTEALCNDTGVAALAVLGITVGLPFFQSLAGVHDHERVRLISAHAGRAVEPAQFFAEWDRLTSERMARDGIPLKPGAVELLAALKGRVPLALVTSSRRGPAREKLAAAGLDAYFDRVVTVDDVTHPKPDPDPYLTAARALGVAVEDCAVFEDSAPGVASGHAAGCHVVQVPDGHGAPSPLADTVAPTLLDGARAVGLIA